MNNPYDRVRYPNWPASETHPASLGAIAALFDRKPPPFSGCRVLEIGCGEAVNLMSLALGAPRAEFVGIDLAEAPVAQGRALAAAAGLGNVSLCARDITAGSEGLGLFDYIIAHGVYAWVPAGVREALMRLCGACLKPDGLLFVSYNVLPGCHLREALRDLMCDAAAGLDDPLQRVDAARTALARAIELWSEADPFQNALIVEARDALKRPAAVLFHDELGGVYAPQFISAVAAAARAVGLDYLCDAKADRNAEALFPSAKFADNARADWARFEQAQDFADMRRFRRSVFCRAGAIDRTLRPLRLRGLWATADVKPIEAGEAGGFAFRAANGAEIATEDERFAALLARLGEAFPQSVPLDDVAAEPALAEPLLRLVMAKIAGLLTEPLRFTTQPGERPLASPLARAQAAQGESVLASLLHRPVRMEDAAVRGFVTLIDGARTRQDLARAMAAETGVAADEVLKRTHAAVNDMARLGLMLA